MKEVLLPYLFFVIAFVIDGCATSPTGRKQLTLLDSAQVNQMGDQSFEQLKKEKPIVSDVAQNRFTRCVVDQLLVAMNEDPQKWEVLIFKDESPNAFALPGQNIGVHTGMLKLAKNQHQLAAVLGHEIGHVLAEHGNERISQSLVAQLGLQVAQIALGNDSQQDQLILAGLGIGAQIGVILPFSRKHEREADTLGIQYMAKAGFDPRQAAELWKLMAAKEKGSSLEFLSTHPSSTSRIKDLSVQAKDLVPVYEKVTYKPSCS